MVLYCNEVAIYPIPTCDHDWNYRLVPVGKTEKSLGLLYLFVTTYSIEVSSRQANR